MPVKSEKQHLCYKNNLYLGTRQKRFFVCSFSAVLSVLSIDEVIEAYHNGKLDEAFGTGTAAVVSPMGLLDTEDEQMVINNGEIGKIAQTLYTTLTDIQWGRSDDPYGWTTKVD